MTSTVNVRDYGAVGDGKSDDTEAIRKAIEALPEKDGVLFFPPGHYLSDTIEAKGFTTYTGHCAWAYSYREIQGTVLSPVRPDQPCLIKASNTHGTRFVGLILRGFIVGENPGAGQWEDSRGNARDEMHGIYFGQGGSDQAVIDDCRIERFSGSGVKLDQCGVWAVRHSLIIFNRLHGIDAENCWDGWIHDTQLVRNGQAGLFVTGGTTITGNRIEHNDGAGILLNSIYGGCLQITGNLFCSNGGPAIECDGNRDTRAEAIAITGNTLRFSGVMAKENPDMDCQARLVGMQGLSFTGNTLWSDEIWKREGGCCYPSYGMIFGQLKDSVVSNNTLFHAATKELIRDEGGHENTVITNNPGRLLIDRTGKLVVEHSKEHRS